MNPYHRVEAETMAAGFGLKTDRKAGTQHYITSIHNGDWLKLRSVDFGKDGASAFTACVASMVKGGSIELRVDALGGPIIGTLDVSPTGGIEKWLLQSTSITAAKEENKKGVYVLFLLFKGGEGELFNVDYWKLK